MKDNGFGMKISQCNYKCKTQLHATCKLKHILKVSFYLLS